MFVRELARFAHPRGSGDTGIYRMMQAYYDESGIGDHADVCVIAGYWGPYSDCVKFDAQWKNINNAYNVPEFHARRFWARDDSGNRVSPYVGLSDEKADKYLERLVACIQRHRIFPVLQSIVVSDWKRLPLDDRKYLTGAEYRNGRFRTSGSPNKSYYLPFQFCVLSPLRYCPSGQKVRYYFGLDRTFSDYAGWLYKRIFEKFDAPERHRMGECGFELAKDTPGLQAADMLAYEAYQNVTRGMKGIGGGRFLIDKLTKNMKPGDRDKNLLIDMKMLHRIAEVTHTEARKRQLNDKTSKE